jgi:CRISPR/Cas system CSM-associated protein Csm5 (group 7 of RAMP superfamily)
MIKLNFKTITPIHISSGEELGYGLDYVIRYDTFCRLDFLNLSQKLAKLKKIDFSKEYHLNDIRKIILDSDKFLEKEDYSYRLKIKRDFYGLVNSETAVGMKFVKEFISSNGRFYIPASSVKGAILTILNMPSLGIIAGDAADIRDKFVFRDSEYIPYDNFVVMLTTNRPPKTSLICLRPDSEFNMEIMKKGKFEINKFKDMLSSYSNVQIKTAKEKIQKFRSKNDLPKGADLFNDALEKISNTTLNKDEYLINIGFGGGSWFKVNEGTIPMFKSKSPNRRGENEEAHTSVSLNLNNEYNHIGWCKIKIIEQ